MVCETDSPEPTAEEIRTSELELENTLLREVVRDLAAGLAWTTAHIRCIEHGIADAPGSSLQQHRRMALIACEELLLTAKALK